MHEINFFKSFDVILQIIKGSTSFNLIIIIHIPFLTSGTYKKRVSAEGKILTQWGGSTELREGHVRFHHTMAESWNI